VSEILASGASRQTLTYLHMLADSARPGQFFDLRWQPVEGLMRRRFLSARGIEATALTIARLAVDADVYLGVALRSTAQRGGKDAIGEPRILYVDSDYPGTPQLVSEFACPPTLTISSGTRGHFHLYWLLTHPVRVAQLESANRRLALALGGDPGSSDAARILRPPETLNHKHDPPARVLVCSYRPKARYSLTRLARSLPPDYRPFADPPHRLPRRAVSPIEQALRSIPAEEYVRVLARREPNQAGKVLCPFHTEKTPSLQLYPDGTFYCFGAGCRRAGTIFDFAANLWGVNPRGGGFIQLLDSLATTFGLSTGGPAERRGEAHATRVR
jgi:hypothetical protein